MEVFLAEFAALAAEGLAFGFRPGFANNVAVLAVGSGVLEWAGKAFALGQPRDQAEDFDDRP